MKTLFTLGLSLLCGVVAHAAPLKKATFTRVVNDVKLLPDQKQPIPAKIGDLVTGTTSVTTGVQSRAELKFDDNSLTRLGANSVFTIEQGTRNMDLKQGVMLLQVPKQLGGAKVRTAAVTAAVTGTTIMVEYQPNGYVKVIVLEGQVDLFNNEDPSIFRTFGPGDMAIMKPNTRYIPEAVQVDLPLLKKTSTLTSDKEFGALGNEKYLKQAEANQNQQKKTGELTETALVIPGKGNTVIIDADRIRDLLPQIGTAPPSSTPAPENQAPVNNAKAGVPGRLGGVAVIDNHTSIITDPKINTAFNGTFGTGAGKIYRPGTDPRLGKAFFDADTRRLGAEDRGTVPLFDQKLRAAGNWGAFRFDEVHLIGSPNVNTKGGPVNLMLVSDTDFTLSNTDPFHSETGETGDWDLNLTTLKNIAIIARNDIIWQENYAITGSDQNLLLYTQVSSGDEVSNETPGTEKLTSGDISIYSSSNAISLPGGSADIHAARDLTISGPFASTPPNIVQAAKIDVSADRDVTLGSNAALRASESMKVRAGRNINIYDSTILRRLALSDNLTIQIVAETGNISSLGSLGRPVTIEGSTVEFEAQQGNITFDHTNVSADFLRVQTLSDNGTILIGNTNLTAAESMTIYADGSNGAVRFVADSRLSGPNVSIAGRTVQVDNNVRVNVTNPNTLNVYSDNENFNRSGYGNFTTSGSNINFVPSGTTGAHKGSFSSRP